MKPHTDTPALAKNLNASPNAIPLILYLNPYLKDVPKVPEIIGTK